MKVIFISRYVEFDSGLDPIPVNILSKKIGIISHYLADYVCLPHAKRWTFFNSMFKHLRYESELDEYVAKHDFKKNIIDTGDIDIYDAEGVSLKSKIVNYIEDVIEEYSLKVSFQNDLDFALSLNLKISYFILDTIKSYNKDIHSQFAFEF